MCFPHYSLPFDVDKTPEGSVMRLGAWVISPCPPYGYLYPLGACTKGLDLFQGPLGWTSLTTISNHHSSFLIA
jgi:hypothetical protein